MNTLINESNLNTAHEEGKQGNGGFNCYGAMLYALGKSEVLDWVCGDSITEFIDNNTVVVDEADIKKGDILVLYGYEEDCLGNVLEEDEDPCIIHTALYIERNLLFHKKGMEESEYTTKEGVYEIYDCEYSEVRRLK